MKIEIDTREESAQDLRRIARLLEQLADKQPVASTTSTSSVEPQESASSDAVDPEQMPGAFGMFDDEDDEQPAERASADEDFRISTY